MSTIDYTKFLDGKALEAIRQYLIDNYQPKGSYALASHTHGNISNTGTITSTVVTSATGVLVYDSNNKIQRATAAQTRAIIGAGTSNLALGTTGITAAAGNHLYHYWTGNAYYYDSYSGEKNWRIITENVLGDILRWQASTIANKEYWDYDSSSWKASSLDFTNLLDGNSGSNVSIPYAQRKFRFTMTANNGWPTNCLLCLEGSWFSSGTVNKITGTDYYVIITVETRASSSDEWAVKATANFTQNCMNKLALCVTTLHTGNTLYRFTIELAPWTSTANSASLKRLMILSNYSGASLTPFTYNGTGKVTAKNTLNATTLQEGGVNLASKYLGISAKAADSDKLDGNDSSYYLNYNNLTNKPIFFATYGTTTGEQIAAAIAAGQYVCCIYNGNVYGNVMLHSGEARYYFSGLYGSYTRLVVRCSTTGATWTNNSAAFLGGFNVDGTSRVSSNAGQIFTINSDYNPSTNKLATANDIPTESTVSGWGFTKNTGTVTSVDSVSPSGGGDVSLSAVRYVSQSLTDAQKTQARTNIGAGTSNFTGYTTSNKLSTNYIQNDAGWSSFSGYTSSNKLSTDYINNVAGWTSNTGTVTSVRAGTGLSISGGSTTTPQVNIADGYALLTTAQLENLDHNLNKLSNFYTTASATANAFTVTIPGITALSDGMIINVKFNAATASGATLNVNNLGAKAIYYRTGTAVTTHIIADNYVTLAYDATNSHWVMLFSYDANTNTIGYQIRTNSALWANKTGYTMNRYTLLFEVNGGLSGASTTIGTGTSKVTVSFKYIPGGAIKYYSTSGAIANNANFGATGLWDQYAINLAYTFNIGSTLTSGKPVYMRCSINTDGTLTPNYSGSPSHPITQDLPTTEDGYVYVFLGQAYSTSNIELYNNHPIYQYKGGKICLYSAADVDTGATSITTSGSGNVVSGASYDASTRQITLTKDIKALVAHQSIKTLKTDNTTAQSISSSEAIAGSGTINLHKVAKTGTYSDLIGTPTIPTKTSDLTNDSGYITSSAISGKYDKTGGEISGAVTITASTGIPLQVREGTGYASFVVGADNAKNSLAFTSSAITKYGSTQGAGLTLSFPSSTASHTLNLPDKDGTIATTGDFSVSTGTTKSVTANGNTLTFGSNAFNSTPIPNALPTTTTAGQVLKSTSTAGTVEWGSVTSGTQLYKHDIKSGNGDYHVIAIRKTNTPITSVSEFSTLFKDADTVFCYYQPTSTYYGNLPILMYTGGSGGGIVYVTYQGQVAYSIAPFTSIASDTVTKL